jgi:hypothetical protein
MLGRERDHRGGAAESRRGGGAFERIGIDDARGRELLDMGVAVDAAGQHQFAARVDLASAGRQAAADGSDGLAGNGDIGLEHVAGGRDASAANHEVVGGFGHDVLRSVRPPSAKGKLAKTRRRGRLARNRWTARSSHSTLWHDSCKEETKEVTMSRPRILVINPNSNVAVTKGLEEALKPLDFAGRARNRLRDAGRGTLRNREPGRCRQRGDAAAPADRERQQRGRLCDRLLQRSRSACLPRRHRPAGVRHRRMRRDDRDDARRNLRRHRDRPTLDPPAYPLSAPDGADGPAGRRAAAQHERGGDRLGRRERWRR